MRTALVALLAAALVWAAAAPVLAASTDRPLAMEFLGGVLGGTVGVALGVAAIGQLTPLLSSRPARVAAVVSGVTLGGGLGATAGVLAAGKLLDVEGMPYGCVLGALAGGLLAAFVEPLLYLVGIPEETTEFLGLLLLPILPAAGATIGFNWGSAVASAE